MTLAVALASTQVASAAVIILPDSGASVGLLTVGLLALCAIARKLR